jgi:WD40 repeat protein
MMRSAIQFPLIVFLAGACAMAEVKPPVTAIASLGDDVVVGSQSGIVVRGSNTKLKTQLINVHDLSFSPSGKMLAAVGGAPADSGSIELYNRADGKLTFSKAIHTDVIFGLAWQSDGARLVTAGADGVCHVFDVARKKVVRSFDGHSRPVLAVVMLPDGKTVVSTGVDQTVRVWDADTGKQIRSLHNHTMAVRALSLRPGGGLPMVGSAGDDRTVRLWQPTIGRMVRFVRLDAAPLALAWSNDGSRLLASCDDGAVYVIDPDTVEVKRRNVVFERYAYTLVSVANSNRFLAGGPNGSIRTVKGQ